MASPVDCEIEFGGAPQDVTIVLSGVAEVADLLRLNAELVEDVRFRRDIALLVDVTRLDTTQLTELDVAAATAPVGERDWDKPPSAVAIVAGSGQAALDAQLWRAHLGGSRSQRRIFATTEEALAWLQELRGSQLRERTS